MRSCLYRVKELNPPMLAAEQHQDGHTPVWGQDVDEIVKFSEKWCKLFDMLMAASSGTWSFGIL